MTPGYCVNGTKLLGGVCLLSSSLHWAVLPCIFTVLFRSISRIPRLLNDSKYISKDLRNRTFTLGKLRPIGQRGCGAADALQRAVNPNSIDCFQEEHWGSAWVKKEDSHATKLRLWINFARATDGLQKLKKKSMMFTTSINNLTYTPKIFFFK